MLVDSRYEVAQRVKRASPHRGGRASDSRLGEGFTRRAATAATAVYTFAH